MFLNWCKKEGVVMPKIEYPATFENGLKGIRCTSDIAHREAFLFVPFKMMYTLSKVQNNEILKPIIKRHPKCFHGD